MRGVGAQTTVMVMGCVGENLYAVVEGGTHVFPPDLSGMAKGVSKYVQPIWRAKVCWFCFINIVMWL